MRLIPGVLVVHRTGFLRRVLEIMTPFHRASAVLTALLLASSLASHGQQPNYDESKVPDYKLPEPLALGGTFTRSKDTWEKKMRPATLAILEREMYGSPPAPAQPLSFSFDLENEVRDAGDGTVVRRSYLISFSHPESPQLRLLLYLPRGARKVPAFLGLNFRGNHTLEKDPRIPLETGYVLGANRTGDNTTLAAKNRGIAAGRWPVTTITDRGYALATLCCGNIDPDFDDGFRNGVHAMFPTAGKGGVGNHRYMGLGSEPHPRCPGPGAGSGRRAGGGHRAFPARQDRPLGRCERPALRDGDLQQLGLRGRSPQQTGLRGDGGPHQPRLPPLV